MVDVALVKIWGELAGAIRWNETEQLASFQYDENFIKQGWDLSPIHMPITNGTQIHRFPNLRKSKEESIATFKGLPGLLADMLPDKYGNELINIWLAQNGRPANSMNPVEQLCFIGSRGMGALEFEPNQPKNTKTIFSVEVASLVAAAQKMLTQRENFKENLAEDEKKVMIELLKIGTSAGGARPKAIIAYNPITKEIKSGQAAAPKGFEQWMIKLDGVSEAQFNTSQGFGRVEYAYYLMATDCGINMMPCQLLEENVPMDIGRAHFMTKRFDRTSNNTKLHAHTFCGIQHFDYNNLYSYSYEQLFQTMRVLRLSYPEAEEMFRRMVFNVMATNYDDHTKNFSFLMAQGEQWQLAPAYDVCYAYDPTNIWVNQHSLSINGKHKDITLADLLTLAKTNNIKNAKQIIEETSKVVSDWSSYAKKAQVNEQLANAIEGTLNTIY